MASDINSAMSGSHLWNLRPVDDRRPHHLAQVSERSSKSFRRRLTCGSFGWGFKRNNNEKHWQNKNRDLCWFIVEICWNHAKFSFISNFYPCFSVVSILFQKLSLKAVLLFPQRRAPRQTNLIQISRLRREPLKKSFGLNPVPVLMGETDVKRYDWNGETNKIYDNSNMIHGAGTVDIFNIYSKVHLNVWVYGKGK